MEYGFGKSGRSCLDCYAQQPKSAALSGASPLQPAPQRQKSCTDGRVSEGKMNGRVKVTFPNDDCYDGEWKDGMENGSGKKIYSISGEVYVGEWKEGKCNGRGKYSYGGGEVYDGEWKEDKCNGTG